ncbi:MAG: hypothetical protein MUE40_16040 [Anaerolineae bacterium]|nr:hypothetical protein [Anaerolineae bacterium]
MGLQEQIAEAIINAFDELGGDPQGAVAAARHGHESVETWIQQETATIALAGGAEMLIPGLHALTIPAGITFLIHRMAYISRGIGALKHAYIVETARHSDLRNILTLWANDSYYNLHLLDFKAIDLATFQYAMTDEGYAVLAQALANATAGKPDAVLVRTLQTLKLLVDEFAGDERAMALVRTLTDEETTDDLIAIAQKRSAHVDAPPKTRTMSQRMSTRLALRLAGQISARVPAKLLVGFIPIAGAVVNAFFNAQTILSMAETARKYYANRFTIAELQALAQPVTPPSQA